MTRVGVGVVAAVAVLSSACMHGSRSAKAEPGAGEGKMIATAAQSGETSAPADASAKPGAKKQVEGRVELIDRANNVTLAGTESVGHAFDKLKVDEDTKITVNGEEATLAEVNPGDEVRASFSGEGDELRVEQLDVVSSSRPGTGSSSDQGSAPSTDQGSGSTTDQGSGSANQR